MTGHKTPWKSPGKRKSHSLGSYYEQILARLFNRFGRSKSHRKLLLLGLDGAGKTTLLRHISRPPTSLPSSPPPPTVGFTLASLPHRGVPLILWDVGGQEKIRALWHHYFLQSDGLLFVVDCSDAARIPEARKELHKLLHEPDLKEALLLVYANKQDGEDGLSVEDVTDFMDLAVVADRPWHVQGCCASTGKGVFEGLDWLVETWKPA